MYDVKNDFAYVLQFFSLISDSLGGVHRELALLTPWPQVPLTPLDPLDPLDPPDSAGPARELWRHDPWHFAF